MSTTRGEFLKLGAALAGGLALGGCTEVTRRISEPEAPTALNPADKRSAAARHALNRLGYGPRPGDVLRVQQMGTDAYVEDQLAPERIEERWAAWMRLLPMDTLDMDAQDAEDWETANYPEVGKGQAAVELQQAFVLRATYSARQLEQAMVEFWTDHFNVSQLKGECSWLKTVDDRLLRKHAMGKFRDLVTASAHSPAMLFYLDNDKNRKRDPATHSGANENYARELLELHTLGVDGGYTLQDIQEVARCFTGWTYKKGFTHWPGDFQFNAGVHDDGPKRVLGVPIPAGGGIKDADQVVDIVCRHPSTARFVSRKLCRRFVADRPSAELVQRVAEVFRRTDGDIRQVLSELFHCEEFQRSRGRKFKRPLDFTVSALRALNADTTGPGILPYLEQMGQLPYKWAMPDGYPDRLEAWTPSMLARWNFAVDLLRGAVPGTHVDAPGLQTAAGSREPHAVLDALAGSMLGSTPAVLSKAAREVSKLTEEHTRQWLALCLAAPEFQRR